MKPVPEVNLSPLTLKEIGAKLCTFMMKDKFLLKKNLFLVSSKQPGYLSEVL